MELLDHMVVLFLIFWGTSILFSIVAVPICIPNSSAQGFPFLHILTSTCYFFVFLIIAIFTGVWWYLSMVLICIVPLINDVEHLFMCCWPSVCLLWKNVYLSPLPTFFHNPHLKICLLILEKEEGGGGEKDTETETKRNINVRENHLLTASHMCPDWGWSPQPSHVS